LLTAAGFPNGIDATSNYVTTTELPTAKQAEILDGMMHEAGIRGTVNPIDYSSVYVPKYRNGSGQYEGYVYKSAAGGATGGDVMGIMANEYWSKAGVTFHGFSASGKNDQSGDPQVDSILEKGRVERDLDKRRQLGFELQRYLAGKMYAIQSPGVGSPFDMAWPALANFSVFRGPGNRQNYKIWIDETKAPFKTS
jgi:ABC-type transport system substrate-binding protein